MQCIKKPGRSEQIPHWTADRLGMAIVGFILLAQILMAVTGIMDLRVGDFSDRVLRPIGMKLDLVFFQKQFWTDIWPPLPFIISKGYFLLLDLVGVPGRTLPQAAMIGGALASAVSNFLAYRLVQRLSGSKAAFLALAIAAAVPITHAMQMSLMGEVFALPFILGGMLVLVSQPAGIATALKAGGLFLLATLCRSETPAIFLVASLTLLVQRQWRAWLVLVLTSMLYFIGAHLVKMGDYSYFNLSGTYNFSSLGFKDRVALTLVRLGEAFSANAKMGFGVAFLALAIPSVVLLLRARKDWQRLPFALPGLVWMGVLLFINTFLYGMFHVWNFYLPAYFMALGIGICLPFVNLNRFSTLSPKIAFPAAAALGLLGLAVASRPFPLPDFSRTCSGPAKAVTEWINANSNAGEQTVLDYTGWDMYLQAHLNGSFADVRNWGYTRNALPASDIFDARVKDAWQRRHNILLNFIDGNRPKFYVHLAPGLDQELRKDYTALEAHLRKPSFLSENLRAVPQGMELVTDSPKMPKAILTNAYANDCFIVDRFSYPETAVAGPQKSGKWTVDNAVLVPQAPGGNAPAPVVAARLQTNGKIFVESNGPVKAGEKISLSLTLWGDEPAKVRLYLSRSCGSSNYEDTQRNVIVQPTPMRYTIQHTFNSDHKCARLLVRNVDEGPVDITIGALTDF